MASLSDIFSWFETGDVPTQQQFQETFSSFYHKEGKIPFLQVQGLTEAFESVASADSIDTITADLETRAKANASNLNPADVISWKQALDIANIAVVDSSVGANDGNVYNKTQIDEFITTMHNRDDTNAALIDQIRETLASDDVNLDELQEVVDFIKQNREDIEALQAVVIGATTDDKITLTGNYSAWGAITLQNQFNDALFNKVNVIEDTLNVGKIKHREVIQVNTTINHQMQAEDVIVIAKDTVTNFYIPVRSQFVDLDNTRVEFDDLPVNPLEIIIKKI